MLNERDLEPNTFKVYIISGKRNIESIILIGVFDSADYAINYCNYYLSGNQFYVVDPKGNVIY